MKKKGIILIIIIEIIILIVGSVIAGNNTSKISIPLGTFLMNIPIASFAFFVEITVMKDVVENFKKSKKTKRKVSKKKKGKIGKIEGILFLTIWSFIVVGVLLEMYSSVVDMYKGPKEIILCSSRIHETMRRGRYIRERSYLIGTTDSNKNIRIEIRGDKARKDINTLIKKDKKLHVYYFENINMIYYTESLEKNYINNCFIN